MMFTAGLSADEQVARRLQAEYDREMAAYLVDHPDEGAMRRMAGHAFNPTPRPSTTAAQPTAGQTPQQGAPRPSSNSGVAPVRYPEIGSGTGERMQPELCLLLCVSWMLFVMLWDGRQVSCPALKCHCYLYYAAVLPSPSQLAQL